MTAKGDIPRLFPPRMFTLRIELLESIPPIWRSVQVPSDLTLDRVHDVIQTSMGWTNSHLHSFIPSPGSGSTPSILTPFDEEEG
ncbi:MAG: plasmid pRiA4b ORF-3 family protein, partial [Actinomycetales bacterium]|nr:plasmid pRiA4b ORF-3 family protein [Actinomycetales bacterium]